MRITGFCVKSFALSVSCFDKADGFDWIVFGNKGLSVDWRKRWIQRTKNQFKTQTYSFYYGIGLAHEYSFGLADVAC